MHDKNNYKRKNEAIKHGEIDKYWLKLTKSIDLTDRPL